MVLFESSVLKLDYSPATDILEVEYPDLHDFLLPEIKRNIDTLVEVVGSYDVKKLLLDSTRTVVTVNDAESREVASYLAAGLAGTRLRKVARVQSPSAAVETRAQENIQHIQHAQPPLPFLLQNFTGKAEALAWLRAGNR